LGNLVSKLNKPPDVSGPNGLLLSVVFNAYKDLVGNNAVLKQEAAEFFLSDRYRVFLDLLELPVDLLPQGVSKKELEEMNENPGYELPMPLFHDWQSLGESDLLNEMWFSDLPVAEIPSAEPQKEVDQSPEIVLPENAPKWAKRLLKDIDDLEQRIRSLKVVLSERRRPPNLRDKGNEIQENHAELPMPIYWRVKDED
jgi:hypothetical protein